MNMERSKGETKGNGGEEGVTKETKEVGERTKRKE